MPELRDISVVLEEPDKCGIFEGLTRAEYDAIDAMNCSSVKEGLDIQGKSYEANPRLIRHAWQTPDKKRESAAQDAMDFGTAMHMAVLEPGRFQEEVVAFDGTRRGEEWKEFQAAHEGKVILKKTSGTSHNYDNVERVLNEIIQLDEWELLTPYMGDCQREVAVVTYENGMAKKGLLDMPSKSGRAYLDLKTTSVRNWSQYDVLSWRLGYWVSMGSYQKWWNKHSAWQVERCIQVVVVVTPPYDLLVRPMDPMSLVFGWQKQVQACNALKSAIRSGKWYGGGGGMEFPIMLPTWAIPDDDSVVVPYEGE